MVGVLRREEADDHAGVEDGYGHSARRRAR
jgi:hypothetical protein